MKIEYSDLYKFIVSLGVGFIALAFLIPWLFLREPFDLIHTQETIENLTPLARSLIELRHQYISTIFALLPVIAITLLVLGVILSVYGIYNWWARYQKFADELQILKVQEAEQRLKTAKSSVVDTKMRAEAFDELEDVSIVEVEDYRTTASRIERRVAEILEGCRDENYKLLRNKRVGHAIFDFLLLSRILPSRKYKNHTIEVKYIRKGFKFGWLRDNLLKVLYLSDIFENETKLPSFPVLMIVGEGNTLGGIKADQYLDRLKSEMNALDAKASIVFLDEAELDRMNCEQLMGTIDSGTL